MTTTTRRPAAKRTVKRPPSLPVEKVLDAPSGALDLDALPEVVQETSHLFTLNGIEYHVVSNPPPGVGLKYLRMARTQDPMLAQGWLLETLLGEDAYTALMNYDRLTDAILDQIINVILKTCLGGVEASKDPLGRG
jgi:hypothetical protein